MIKISDGLVGIYMWDFGNVDIDIKNNKVNLVGGSNPLGAVAGIAASQVGSFTSSDLDIESNVIRNTGYGIYVNNVMDASVKYNNYNNNLNTSGNYYGVYAAGCPDIVIESNTLKQNTQPTLNDPRLNYNGIFIENSPTSFVFNNLVFRNGKGITARGNDNNSAIMCNKLTKNYNGVFLDNATIGAQGGMLIDPTTNQLALFDQDNKWNTNIGPNRIDGAPTNTNSTWYYRNGNAFNISPFSLGSGVTPSLNPANSFCPFSIKPVVIGPKSTQRQKIFYETVFGITAFNSFVQTNEFFADAYAMTRFDLDSTWLNVGDSLDIDYQNYFNANGAGCMGSVCGTARAYESSNYSALAASNATFSTTDPLTSNIKDVNNIFLDTWAQDVFKFDAAQEFRLQELACSDAMIDGSAVYSARSLLGWYYQCSTGAKGGTYIPNEEPENAIVLNETITISMYQNPTNGLLQLDYDLGQAGLSFIQVFDLSGKLVHSEIIQDSFGTMELDLTSLSSGVYIYKVNGADELLASGKLVIK